MSLKSSLLVYCCQITSRRCSEFDRSEKGVSQIGGLGKAGRCSISSFGHADSLLGYTKPKRK